MALLQRLLDFLVNANQHLELFTQQYGVWVYVVLFLVVFCESGFLVGCFLPGDSLLFASGALTATGVLDLPTVLISLTLATIVGYNLNFWQGERTGPHIFTSKHKRFFKAEHVARTHQLVEKFGPEIILVARFIGFVRTFAPFIAGVGEMNRWKFNIYSVIGGILWVHAFVLIGYYLFDNPIVQKYFG